MTEAEFDITNNVLTKSAKLYLVVYQWSDGSYLEDQDQWWLSGIFRDVELQCRPCVGIQDYHIITGSDPESEQGVLNITVAHSVPHELLSSNYSLEVEILDTEAKETNSAKIVTVESLDSCSLAVEMTKPKLWSCNKPYLYTVVIQLIDGEGRSVQVEHSRVGVRSLDIVSGQLCVNGSPLRICGVNRHEFDAYKGKVIGEELMLQDIKLLKQNNFNAVRCSHYPNVHRWYELCDELGIYLVDEANMETHGFLQFPAMSMLQCDSAWREQILWRTKSMFHRSKNYSSIIVYSLGNESGLGPNTRAAADWLRSVEKHRPVQYEGGIGIGDAPVFIGTGNDPYVTDIVCPMYHSPLRIAKTVRQKSEGRPLILCEYAHAMGNSGGGLHLYHDLFASKAHPQLQGGFVWDMVDQGISLPWRNDGNFGYGGDFGKHSGVDANSFCINGLLSPDRKEHPMMIETKYLQQTIAIAYEPGARKSEIVLTLSRLSNEAPEFEDLRIVGYLITPDKPYGKKSKPELAQDCSVFNELISENHLEVAVDGQSRHGCWLRIDVAFRIDKPFAPAGHVVATETFQLVSVSEPSTLASSGEFSSAISDTKVVIATSRYFCDFNLRTGQVEKLCRSTGELLLTTPLSHCFYRAPTENDCGGEDYLPNNRLRSFKKQWTSLGLHKLRERVRSAKVVLDDPAMLVVAVRSTHATSSVAPALFTTTTRYTFSGATMKVDVRVVASKLTWLAKSLPRVGIQFAVPSAMDNVVWQGCGPHECYVDRKRSAAAAVYKRSVDAMYHSYVVPSENGGRCDVKWAVLSDPAYGNGLRVSYACPDAPSATELKEGFSTSFSEGRILPRPAGSDGAQFSVSRYQTSDLDKSRHQHELEADEDNIWVNIDTAHMGLGGDCSWLPLTHKQYLFHGQQWNYSLDFEVI